VAPFVVKTSPHLNDRDSTARIMWSVVLALVPALIASVYVFGYAALVVTLTCVVSCVACEAVLQKIRGVPVTVNDGSAAVTGMLLAFVLPPAVPMWVCVLGSVISIGLAKQLFGGLGCNIWNPALVGRAVLQISLPTFINAGAWPVLKGDGGFQLSRVFMDIHGVDVVTQATPLSVPSMKGAELGYHPLSLKLLFGDHPGSLGETSFILLALGGIALILMKRVKWQLPAFYIGTVALLTWVFPYNPAKFLPDPATGQPYALPTGLFEGDPLYHVVFGGLALGAFFMAADMVTSPLTTLGQIIFAVGCGALTAVIRLYGGYPEGVCYSILIMNTAVPLIDRYVRPRVLGAKGVSK
jgi:electron transport complex protein RnfD